MTENKKPKLTGEERAWRMRWIVSCRRRGESLDDARRSADDYLARYRATQEKKP